MTITRSLSRPLRYERLNCDLRTLQDPFYKIPSGFEWTGERLECCYKLCRRIYVLS